MARYSMKINGNPMPQGDVVWPKRFRVGYRGPGPGTREAGMVSFKVVDQEGVWRRSSKKIETDQEVLVERSGEKIFRGVISRVASNDKHCEVDVQAREQGATLKDYKGGMRVIGSSETQVGVQNPGLYVWVTEIEYQGTPVLAIVTNEFIEGLTIEDRVRYEKRWIFTSHHQSLGMISGGGIQLAWATPKNAQEIMEEVRLQYLMQDHLPFIIGDVEESGPSWEGQLLVRDENDEYLRVSEEAGLLGQGNHVFVFWHAGGYVMKAVDVVNRSVATALSGFAIHDVSKGGTNPPVGMTPFFDRPQLVMNSRDDKIVAFYQMYGKYEGEIWYQQMHVAYIDFNDVRGLFAGEILRPHYVMRQYSYDDGRPRKLVELTPTKWFEPLIGIPAPLKKELQVTGGEYYLHNWSGPTSLNLGYSGDLLLDKIVYDFDGASLADILSEVAYVKGCDWWIDGDGRVSMMRVNRIPSANRLNGKILEEEDIYEQVSDDDFDKTIHGNPISITHAKMLAEKWAEFRRGQGGHRKRLEVLAPGYLGVKLGQRVDAGGRRHGILEAMEFDGDKVVLETAL